MESGHDEQFFDQFLDDFFAEADEHLHSVRRHLLEFEDALSADRPLPAQTINDLFRSFHTLKGISAMANVPAAETLAHFMESYLRLLRDGGGAISLDGLDALIASTKKLELVVLARREGSEPPAINAEVEALERVTSGAEEQASPSRDLSESGGARPGGFLYRFVFEPTPELAAQGVNVNAVRSKLQAVGAISDSKPVVKDDGKIAFEFVVESAKEIPTDEDWESHGITRENLGSEELPPASFEQDGTSYDAAGSGLFGKSNVVRVDLERLDELMRIVGELVISRAVLAERVKKIEHLLSTSDERDLQEANQRLEKQLRDLRDGVMRVRMVPIGEVFERMKFVARDLARETGKLVKLDISGQSTEIDKLLVERMVDPLLHLVRNAISHGIEKPDGRTAAGKPRTGTIALSAAMEGETVVIQISDDGQGIDAEAIAARAGDAGLGPGAGELDEPALLDILCSPGFSTKKEADKASGRGVGMDVVRRVVDDLGGTLSLNTARRNGTTFTIRLPLTLSIADALIVTVDGERFAVPQSNVDEVIRVEPGAVTRFENNEVVRYREEALPLIRLAEVFDLQPSPAEDPFHALVVNTGKSKVGIGVDRVLNQREIVIRPIVDPLGQAEGISGATELGDGRAVLILNVAEVVDASR